MWLFYLNGKTLAFITDFILAAIILSAAFIDAKHMIIPDRLNAAGALAGLILALFSGLKGLVIPIIGAVTGIAILMLLYWMGKIFFHREGVGMGDVKLAAVIGLFIGPFWSATAILIAVFSGGIWGIIQILGKRRMTAGQIPFGPFISLGGGAVLFFRAQIAYVIELYISLL
jgi:leader peptidase (prepilin peptidase)/N-methyltransferase